MPPEFSILSGDTGFAVVVPDFTPASRRRAARVIWENHVGGGNPLKHVAEFTQLNKAGQELTWYRYSEGPDETWGDDGDLRDDPIKVIWYLDEDIPDSYSWSE